MTTANLENFNQLQDAEEYFQFFDLSYDPQIVNINRLHILQKFSQLVKAEDPTATEAEKFNAYRNALQASYEVFETSSGVEQKLFKVFKDRPKNVVMLSEITPE